MDSTRDPTAPITLGKLSRELVDTVAALGGADEIPSLQRLVEVSLASVPSADSVSITSLRHGRFRTTAATDDLSRRGDELQYSLRSGPCVDAVLDETVYRPEDLADDQRWPTFGRRASDELGISSMLAFRLYTETGDSLDGLNFYSRRPQAFSHDDLVRGLLLATQAALAIAHTKARNLARALETSREIGAAAGILMVAHKVTFDDAFDLLRVASQDRNQPLRVVAQEVVRTGSLELTHLP